MLKLTAIVAILAAGAGCKREAPAPSTAAETKADQYYSVLLANNSVYIGKLEGLDSDYPTLKDVFYVQSTINPETKAVANVLVRRSKEWHGPDRMMINDDAVVFIEPVAPDSKAAQMIAEATRQ